MAIDIKNIGRCGHRSHISTNFAVEIGTFLKVFEEGIETFFFEYGDSAFMAFDRVKPCWKFANKFLRKLKTMLVV